MTHPYDSSLPLRRTEAISFQQTGEETLIYDERTHQAYCLNATASLIWRHCDGKHRLEQLVAIVGLGEEGLAGEAVVRSALAQLVKDKLVTGDIPANLPVVSRREMLAKGGAGLALMLPVIAMIAAPSAAQAYTGCFDCSSSVAAQRRRLALQQQHKSAPIRFGSEDIQPDLPSK